MYIQARCEKSVRVSFLISVYFMVKWVFWVLYYNNIPTANATNIINTNIGQLHDLSNALLDNDTIDSIQFTDILNNGYNPASENKDIPSKKRTIRKRRSLKTEKD